VSNEDVIGATARWPRVVALLAFAVATVLGVVGPVITLVAGEPLWPNGLAVVGIYPFVVVGALVALQRPRNPIGWLCLLAGAAFAIGCSPHGLTPARRRSSSSMPIAGTRRRPHRTRSWRS
jgi:hypothetical protein